MSTTADITTLFKHMQRIGLSILELPISNAEIDIAELNKLEQLQDEQLQLRLRIEKLIQVEPSVMSDAIVRLAGMECLAVEEQVADKLGHVHADLKGTIGKISQSRRTRNMYSAEVAMNSGYFIDSQR